MTAGSVVPWTVRPRLLLDDHERIWIQTQTRVGEPSEWRIFERSGERAGWVTLPFGLQLVRGNMAYGVNHDEYDVPSIVAYRIDGVEPTE